MSSDDDMRQVETCQVTIRFPQVDPAGIAFYPRYFETVFRQFPDLPFVSPPAEIDTRFFKPIRLGDRLELVYEHGPRQDDWFVAGRMNGDDYFSMRPLEVDGELSADAHRPALPAFRTAEAKVGNWASGPDGHMHLSRYFESVNIAIEEWFEDTLNEPFHAQHVGRKIGIPTVQFRTRVRSLPAADEPVSVWIRPKRVGKRALTFTSWLVEGGECLVESEQVVVFVRFTESGYHSISIPDDVRKPFEARLAETDKV